MNNKTAWQIYLFGIKVGFFSLLKKHWIIGCKQMLYPVGYWRFPIFPICVDETHSLLEGSKILDIGSPKLLSIYLSSYLGYELYATDICDCNIETRYAVHYNDYPFNHKKGKFITKYEDARSLSFPENYFDLVYSLSVIEHIPDNGDKIAMKEIQRVLKKGKKAIVEVPFRKTYSEDWIDQDIYERKSSGEKIFYQRRYDVHHVIDNLIIPSKMRLMRCIITVEQSSFAFEKLQTTLPGMVYAPFMWTEAVVSFFNHTSLECSLDTLISSVHSFDDRPMNITLVFEKS